MLCLDAVQCEIASACVAPKHSISPLVKHTSVIIGQLIPSISLFGLHQDSIWTQRSVLSKQWLFSHLTFAQFLK